MKQRKNKRSPVSAICSALGTICLIGIIILCVPVTLPKLIGYEVYTVVSGSMEPAIPTGSLVMIKGVDAQEVQAEDVIAFYGGPDSHAIITHRVVENRVVMGEFITKGDANAENDMNPVKYDALIGKVAFSLPVFGAVAQMLTSGEGKIVAALVIVVSLLLHVLAGALEKRGK